jgi:hypothetical protein
MKSSNQGSTLAVVLIITLAISLVTASVVGLINFQRNMAIHRELQFQANNVAETAMDYAFGYVANDVKRKSIEKSDYIPQTAGTYKEFTFEDTAKSFLTSAIPSPSDYSDSTSRIQFTDLAVRVLSRGDKQTFTVKRAVSGSRFNDLDGQIVFETTVPVVARVTASMPGSSKKYTAYIQKQMAFDEVPMFQKAINYQGQLHLHRGYPILGGVHTNGNLLINAHGDDTAIYQGLVTCAGRFYRGSSFDEHGLGSDPYGYCPENADSELDFRAIYTENISLKATNDSSLQIITTNPTDKTITAKYWQLDTNFDSRMTDWKEKALTTFKGNLMDKSHNVAAMLPPGCAKYRLDDATTPKVNEFANGTYVLLHPNITDSKHNAYNPDNIYQFSRAATLLFRVECLANYDGTTTTTTAATPPVTVGDTTEKTFKWIVKAYKKESGDSNDANWVALPLPPGVIGQTKVQTWTPSDSPNAQYEIATNVIDTTKVTGANAANPHLQGLFEEYKITPSTYVINNSGVTIGSVDAVTLDSGTWSHATATGMGSLQAAGYVTGFVLPYSYDTSTKKFASDYTVALGTATNPELIEDTTTASTKTGNILPVQQAPGHGFFDCRLGRGVSPITINMSALKDVLDGTDTTEVAAAFRTLLGVGTNYNGLIYVEFPTSMKTVAALSKRCYKTAATKTPYLGDMSAVDSYAFAVGGNTEIEKRHPDRMLDTDTRADRTDNILPIAKSLRGYPPSYDDSEIAKPQWAIPALVIVNGKKLPTVTGITGLSIATNAPLYLIGSYNSDGDFSTGTNITGTNPTDYAVNDPGWGEVSAGLFSDTLTILSDTWGKPRKSTKAVPDGTEKVYNKTTKKWETVPKYINYDIVDGGQGNRFLKSFDGRDNTSYSLRRVEDGQVEISACILTGEYPIFEFFLHALEAWNDYYGKNKSPICIKGAVVGMFHSEIQHIKGAYSRPLNDDIQQHYHGHGNSAIPAVRLHEQLTKGIFPPGTPMARDYGQRSFAFLRPGNPKDTAVLTAAGF